jgi:hypothetical protein
VGALTHAEIGAALEAGLARAAAYRAAGLLRDAAVTLRGHTLVLGHLARFQEKPS